VQRADTTVPQLTQETQRYVMEVFRPGTGASPGSAFEDQTVLLSKSLNGND